MERDNGMFALVLAAGQAHVAHNTYKPPAKDEGVVAGLPNTVELSKKRFVIRDIAHLIWVIAVIL